MQNFSMQFENLICPAKFMDSHLVTFPDISCASLKFEFPHKNQISRGHLVASPNMLHKINIKRFESTYFNNISSQAVAAAITITIAAAQKRIICECFVRSIRNEMSIRKFNATANVMNP